VIVKKRSEAVMPVIQTPAKTLQGLSFSPDELILAKTWSQSNSLRMVIRLDHGSDTEEFEEVLAIHVGDSSLCRWIVWRDAIEVFVQPLIGRKEGYSSVAEAFESLAAKQPVFLTDIEATGWPV
jgi:hypothetical protein